MGHPINGFISLSLKKEEGKKALTGARETIQSPLWPWRRLEKLTFTGDKLDGESPRWFSERSLIPILMVVN